MWAQDSTPYSRAVSVFCWWPRFWCSLVSELANSMSEASGLPREPHLPTPLRTLYNDMLKLTPRPNGYVPPRKLWLRSV